VDNPNAGKQILTYLDVIFITADISISYDFQPQVSPAALLFGGIMKLTDLIYEDVRLIWDGYLTHPFVQGIGDGSLSMERFRFFMLQDYLYLYDYAKVFAIGVVKAQTPDLMRLFSQLVYDTLNGEMTIHQNYMARLGITDEEVAAARPSLVNTSYTHYMLEIGHNEGILELLVSILSCSWSYQMIGEALNRIPGASEHPFYGEWIQGYTSEGYVADNQKIIDLVNALGASCTEDEVAHLKEIFRNCSRYESLFWDMSYRMEM
jgi:thiaminase/transcriptional activator TenA